MQVSTSLDPTVLGPWILKASITDYFVASSEDEMRSFTRLIPSQAGIHYQNKDWILACAE